jgi:hypothetical protein
MKKSILIGLLALALSLFGGPMNFLDTAVDCAAGATIVNGAAFTSREILISSSVAGLAVTFTRMAGSSSTVDFYFQTSNDNGLTWTTGYFHKVSVATNEAAVANVVRYADREPPLFNGVSHIRLWKIVNNDLVNDLASCNASVSEK